MHGSHAHVASGKLTTC